MPTITDYVTKATTETILQTMYSSAEIVALKVTSWAAGAVARTIYAVVAPVIKVYSDVNTEAIKGGILDFAEGLWLDALGVGVYNTPRVKVTFATTDVTFTNTTGELYDEDAGDVVVSAGTQGPTYRTTAQLYLTPGGQATVGVRAEVAGSGSNAAVGAIDTMVIGPQGVTLNNAGAALATDREEDDPYRERCRLATAATSPMGSKDAYRYVATSAVHEDGTAIGITKVAVISDGTTGDVQVYLADADGAPDPADVTIIDALLEETVVPHGINWLGADGATEVVIDIEGTIVVRDADGLSDDDILDDETGIVPMALSELQAEWPIGGYVIPPVPTGVLPIDEIRARISQAQALPTDPRPIIRVTLTSPAADVSLDENEVFKVGDIDLTIVRI